MKRNEDRDYLVEKRKCGREKNEEAMREREAENIYDLL
jgi:hypothetical protein